MNANHPFSRRGLNPLDENGQPGCAVCGRPPGAHTLTTDRADPELGYGVDREPRRQHDRYLVLSEEERAKGFVRPVYRAYIHHDPECGAVTRMGQALCETYARDPSFYGSTYCSGCQMHRPVGPESEFTWVDDHGVDTGILVGT